MENNRRKFLKNSAILGLGITIVPNWIYSSTKNLIVNTQTLSQLLLQASTLRKQGNITGAITLYNQLIISHPQDIRPYDGKRLCLSKQKFKELEVLNMYQTAMQSFPNNPTFKLRWANCCMQMALGNQKFANSISNKTQLLQQARQAFNQLKQQFPNNPQYQELFNKAKRKQDQNATTIDARFNQELKTYKKLQRKNFKNRLNQKSVSELQSRLQNILSKPQTPERKKRIRELYIKTIRKIRKEQNFTLLFTTLQAFYNWNKLDVNTLALVRKIANKRKNYAFLVNIETQNHQLKNSLWSAIALAEAIIKRRRKENVGNLNQVLNLLNNPQLKVTDSIQEFEKKYLRISVLLMQNNSSQVLIDLMELGNTINNSENQEIINRYTVLVARYFKRVNKKPLMHTALSIGLKMTEDTQNNELLNLLLEICKKKKTSTYHNHYLMSFKNKLEGNG